MKERIVREFAAVGLAFVMLTGCGSQPADTYPAAQDNATEEAPSEQPASEMVCLRLRAMICRNFLQLIDYQHVL